MFGRLAMAGLVSGVALSAQAGDYKAPRTAFGQPDLQGEWTNASFTGLQRPKAFKSLFATEEEAAAYVKRQQDRLVGIKAPLEPGEEPPPPDVGDVESETYEMGGLGLARIDGRLRTSWIVEPTDGRLPYNSLGRSAIDAADRADTSDFDNPEVRMPDERCLMAVGSAAGPPMLNTSQNSHYRIIQTPAEVAIFVEMIHDVRIVRIGGRHPEVKTHPWLGDSIGWWEGDTLVVETVDQNPGAANRFTAGGVFHLTPAAKVTERFTRISETEMRYDFTVDDPAVYARPWRAEMIMTASDEPIYEYACHEGNYALPNILGGGRQRDREAAAAKASAPPAATSP